MKKIIITIGVLIVLGFLGYFIYVNYINKVPKITPEPEKVSVEEYYIYGNHFNIKGTLELSDKSYEDIKLTLYNGEDKDFDIEVDSEDNNTYNGTIEINNNSAEISGDDIDSEEVFDVLDVFFDLFDDEELEVDDCEDVCEYLFKHHDLFNCVDFKSFVRSYYPLYGFKRSGNYLVAGVH